MSFSVVFLGPELELPKEPKELPRRGLESGPRSGTRNRPKSDPEAIENGSKRDTYSDFRVCLLPARTPPIGAEKEPKTEPEGEPKASPERAPKRGPRTNSETEPKRP